MKINPRPVRVCRAARHVGGRVHFATPPLISQERRNVATSGKRRWIALDVNFLKHVFVLENRGHGSGQNEVKGQILSFVTMAPPEAKLIFINVFFFISGRSLDSHRKVLKCPWDGPKQRSGQGQVAKGQLAKMK